MRTLENAPGHRLTDPELMRLVEFTTAPSDDIVQNIVNWGRYAELFRYDADEHLVVAVRRQNPPRSPPTTAGHATTSGSNSSTANDSANRSPPRTATVLVAVL
jgi:hypothetical protein